MPNTVLSRRLVPLAATVTVAAAAAVFLRWLQRNGGSIFAYGSQRAVAQLTDGRIVVLAFNDKAVPSRRVVVVRTIGTPDDEIFSTFLWELSADERFFSTQLLEYVPADYLVDQRVDMVETATGAGGVAEFDNGFPAGILMASDPGAPAELKAAQAAADLQWQKDTADGYTGPPYVVRFKFWDLDPDGQIVPLGWTTDGRWIVRGASIGLIDYGYGGSDDFISPTSAPVPWWRAAGPTADGGWTWLIPPTVGEPPAGLVFVATPPQTRALTVEANTGPGSIRRLLLGGVPQTDPKLAGGVGGVLGPYT